MVLIESVEILDTIIEKKATMIPVPKERPIVNGTAGDEVINFNYVRMPGELNQRLLKHCKINIKRAESGLANEDVEERIRDTNKEKELYIRFAHDIPLSVVTDKFKEIRPSELAGKAEQIIGKKPVIRYFKTSQSLQFNFPLNSRFKGMHALINTGPFGVYGGSGLNAVTYGLAWYNSTCANWTIFLEKLMNKNTGRIVHTKGNGLEQKLGHLSELIDRVEDRIDKSQYEYLLPEELNAYLSIYDAKGLNKKISKQITGENPKGMTVYDLSYRLTELCQDNKLSGTTRARIEYLAGEVILCADQIKENINQIEIPGAQTRQRTGRIISPLPRQYMDVN